MFYQADIFTQDYQGQFHLQANQATKLLFSPAQGQNLLAPGKWACFFSAPSLILCIRSSRSSFLFIANCNNNYCVITTIHHSAVSVSRIHCLYKPSCWILKNSLVILYRLVNDFWQDLNLWWLLLDIQEKITKPSTKLFVMDDCSKCNLIKTKQIEPDLSQPM